MELAFLDAVVPEEESSTRTLERTSNQAMISVRFTLQWEHQGIKHTDHFYAPKLNLWRDIFPPEIESEMMDKASGHSVTASFKPGDLIEGYQKSACLTLANKQFNRHFRRNNYIEPRAGRFYPKGFIAGSHGIYPEDQTPFRIGSLDEDKLTAELNHPLADKELTLTTRIHEIWAAGEEHGGQCNHIGELVTNNGPGMQARWQNQPTDFFSDLPFTRIAPEPDSLFYAIPRQVSHVDSTASEQISQLYQQRLKPDDVVLDLMASWESHLPANHEYSEIHGLGMNDEELLANPLFKSRLVHDLNLDPKLPYEDAYFDAVICSLSVEYLTKPFEVFQEVARVLKPGGQFILTFSNRWFPPKVIRAWEGAHEFERPGIVLEYFLRTHDFEQLETWSSRGLPRPLDDKYANKYFQSDPVFAVWGQKK